MASDPKLFEWTTDWTKARNTPAMVHKGMKSSNPEYITKMLRLEEGAEMERRTIIKVPEYKLDVSRPGVVNRVANF